MIVDPDCKLPAAPAGCLKIPKNYSTKYDLSYVADPDVADRGRLPVSTFKCKWKDGSAAHLFSTTKGGRPGQFN